MYPGILAFVILELVGKVTFLITKSVDNGDIVS